MEEDSRHIGCVFFAHFGWRSRRFGWRSGHFGCGFFDNLEEDLDTLDEDLETLYVYFLNTLEEDLENLKFCTLVRRCGLGLLVINITPMVIPH